MENGSLKRGAVAVPSSSSNMDDSKYLVFGFRPPRLWFSPRWLLACLSLAAIVQGMIFTNVVISSIERRFGLHSTQSGIIAGSYDFGSLLAVIPVTYFGGRPGASKPFYISTGMAVMGTGSLLFASPHFFTDR
jgi:organic anion transporter 4A